MTMHSFKAPEKFSKIFMEDLSREQVDALLPEGVSTQDDGLFIEIEKLPMNMEPLEFILKAATYQVSHHGFTIIYPNGDTHQYWRGGGGDSYVHQLTIRIDTQANPKGPENIPRTNGCSQAWVFLPHGILGIEFDATGKMYEVELINVCGNLSADGVLTVTGATEMADKKYHRRIHITQ